MQRMFNGILALSCVLSCVAYGQSAGAPSHVPAPAASAPSAPPAANPAAVAADQAVISLPGACDVKAGSPKPPTGCVKDVTKSQFEKLVNALKPDLTAEQKRNFAQHYGTLLVFDNAARSLGLENDPKFQLILQFATNQILVDTIREHYTNEYAHPSDQQVEDYYKQNSKKYLEAKLQRVIIPRIQPGGAKPKPSEAEEKAYVDQVRQKWIAGGDPAKLQTEAFARAGVTGANPDVNVGDKRPGSLPAQHDAVFDLKSGDISEPFSDATAFYIYKVVSTRQIPVADVKDSIEHTLAQQQVKDKLEAINASVTPVLNETYFGPAPPPPQAGAMANPGQSMPQSAPPHQAPPK